MYKTALKFQMLMPPPNLCPIQSSLLSATLLPAAFWTSSRCPTGSPLDVPRVPLRCPRAPRLEHIPNRAHRLPLYLCFLKLDLLTSPVFSHNPSCEKVQPCYTFFQTQHVSPSLLTCIHCSFWHRYCHSFFAHLISTCSLDHFIWKATCVPPPPTGLCAPHASVEPMLLFLKPLWS